VKRRFLGVATMRIMGVRTLTKFGQRLCEGQCPFYCHAGEQYAILAGWHLWKTQCL